MDNILQQAVRLWQLEAAVAVSILVTVYIIYRGMKVWRMPDGASLIFILGIGLAMAALLYFNMRDRFYFFADRNALLFILLYCWCALGTVFLAARHTHILKLFVGLASQAGIVYGLYRWL